ncbi:unnamed protein product [Sphagnum balticum]
MRDWSKLYHRRVATLGRHKCSPSARRNGSQIVEFAAAIFLLTGFVAVPALDLSIVPIRWVMAQQLVDSYVRTLAMSETFSEALQILETDPSLTTRLVKLGGIKVESLDLTLKISKVVQNPAEAQSFEVHSAGKIPPAWLPNGPCQPCAYALHIDAKLAIAPAVMMSLEGMNIPGLTAPIPVLIHSSHEWMNLGQDPVSEKYFINE